ncbi:unnamed protein product [Heterobilharzia americana]|nr:unnamed protein product [Heterobilharzia americana]
MCNRQNGSHSVHNTLNSRLPSFQSFTNFHNRRSSRNRSSSSTYRSKILKRCGRQLKRLIGRKVAVEHILKMMAIVYFR